MFWGWLSALQSSSGQICQTNSCMMTVIATLKCWPMKNTFSVLQLCITSYQILLFLIVRFHTIVNYYLNLRCSLSKSRHVICCLSILLLSLLDVKNNDVVPWVLKSILSKYIPSQNPHVRQASCIWLLSLVKRLSQHKEITVGLLLINYDCLKEEFSLGIYICWVTFVCNGNNSLLLPLLLQSHLKEIQVAFISVLSDPDGKKRVLSNQMVRSVCSLLTPASAIQMYLFNITKQTATLLALRLS